MKTLNQIIKHRELVKDCYETFGSELVDEACRLYRPDTPAFFRSQLKVGCGHVQPAMLKKHLADRVEYHDADKLNIARTLETSEPSAASVKRMCQLYAMHDLNHDHHAACWVRNLQSFQVTSFLEHLLDHAAVQMERGCEPFDLDWLHSQQVFYGKRTSTPEGDFTDMEVLFNMQNQNIRFAIGSAARMYRRWVDYFTARLLEINRSF